MTVHEILGLSLSIMFQYHLQILRGNVDNFVVYGSTGLEKKTASLFRETILAFKVVSTNLDL